MSSSTSLTPTQIVLGGTALAVACVSAGYSLGASARPGASQPPAKAEPEASKPTEAATPVQEQAEDSEDEEDLADGELSAVKAGWTEPCKLVLIVRTDLNMTPGKIAAQCSHATLACYKALSVKNPGLVKHWERTGQAKIALKGTSEDQLMELEAIAKSLNLCARAIHDAGRTQVAAGSRTVLGIGPGPVELINKVTGKLRLL